jgi:hypothetical protein
MSCSGCSTVAAHEALGSKRTYDLLIRGPSRLQDTGDIEEQGETKPRFYQALGAVGGTGRDTGLTCLAALNSLATMS